MNHFCLVFIVLFRVYSYNSVLKEEKSNQITVTTIKWFFGFVANSQFKTNDAKSYNDRLEFGSLFFLLRKKNVLTLT